MKDEKNDAKFAHLASDVIMFLIWEETITRVNRSQMSTRVK